ncbi:gamma-glutamylcyclotransferase family protein [Paracoccus albus]|uniref:gamma-glutamylcyclotransferase family protein n=1 Tax=Paracoccus albus TaxID=3017784 RepID=UPI0022F125D6|nr:gamma-glutamylcyclotransferase family protein [Paracoccus albus]WBU59160.1 gamma-glutamylcyclotransferase [Paracoccus albus]
MALYFAYGSNMLSARLTARCASARVIGTAVAAGYDIAFDKIGQDGSGKATLLRASTRSVHGALFHLDDVDLALLDQIEGVGRGYDRQSVSVRHDNKVEQAVTYIAPDSCRDATLLPFDWYRGLVVAGAHERRLPSDWIERVQRIVSLPDPQTDRPRRLEAMQILSRCPAEWLNG